MQRMRAHWRLDAGVKGFIFNMAKKNLWRVASWYELEDLIQDGYLCYSICDRHYGSRCENQAHFMALFKRIFTNHITDLANERSLTTESALSDLFEWDKQEQATESIMQAEPESGTLLTMIMSAPAEVQALVELVMSEDGREKLRTQRHRRRSDRSRETTNELFCRLLRYDSSEINLLDLAQQYFIEGSYGPKQAEG